MDLPLVLQKNNINYFQENFNNFINNSNEKIIYLNAKSVYEIDSIGIAGLINFQRLALKQNKRLYIKNLSEKMEKLTKLYGVYELLTDIKNV